MIIPAATRVAELPLTVGQVEEIAPSGSLGAKFLLAVRWHLPANKQVAKEQLLTIANTRAPNDPEVLALLGFSAIEQLRVKKEACLKSTQACNYLDPHLHRKVEILANRLEESTTCDGLRLRSRLLVLQDLNEMAIDTLSACTRCPVPIPCIRERVLLTQNANLREKRQAAELSFLSLSCTSDEECARSESWLGELASKRKDWNSAYSHFLRSAARLPSGKAWLAAAAAAATAGQLANAEIAYQRARTFGERDPETEHLLKTGRSKLLNAGERF